MKNITYLLIAGALCLLTSCDFSSKSKNSSKSTTKTQDQTEQNDSSVDNNNNNGSDTKDNDKKNEDVDNNTFKSAKGYFSINFPMPPATDTTYKETSKAGTLYGCQYTYKKSANGYYIANYIDYNEGMVTDKNKEALLNTRADAFVTRLGGKLTNATKGKLNDYPTLTWSSKINDSLNIQMKSLFVGRRYYQFGTMAYNSEISEKEAKAFIESFKIKK